MILTAHQPCYLPGLRLFDKIARSDTFVFLDTVQYQPRDWNNRNLIKTPQGPQWLTVPVLSKGHREKEYREIEINNEIPWQRKHRRALELNYSKAEHYSWVMGSLSWLFTAPFYLLTTINGHCLMILLDMLGIKTKFLWANHGEFEGTKSDLVLDMCKKLGATKYIFGAQGRNYAKVEDFEREGIEVEFQDYVHPVYPQLHGEFVPNLSVVDLLFNCGPESLAILTGKA